MNAQHQSTPRTNMLENILGFIAVVFVLAVLSGFEMAFIPDMRAATIALSAIGLVMMLTTALVPSIRRHGWYGIETLSGIVLGVVAALIMGSALFGFSLPLIRDDYMAFIVLTIVLAAKVVIAGLPSQATHS